MSRPAVLAALVLASAAPAWAIDLDGDFYFDAETPTPAAVLAIQDYGADERTNAHRKPFAGELDARRQQFLPRQFGVTAVRFLHAGDHAGHGDRAGAMKIAVVLDAWPGKNI